jgi:hypothetical protein
VNSTAGHSGYCAIVKFDPCAKTKEPIWRVLRNKRTVKAKKKASGNKSGYLIKWKHFYGVISAPHPEVMVDMLKVGEVQGLAAGITWMPVVFPKMPAWSILSGVPTGMAAPSISIMVIATLNGPVHPAKEAQGIMHVGPGPVFTVPQLHTFPAESYRVHLIFTLQPGKLLINS